VYSKNTISSRSTATLLCGHLNRLHYGYCPSVCSVQLVTQKGTEKTKLM